MRNKSIKLLLLSFFLVFSVGLKTSALLSVQPYLATDVNNVFIKTTSWSNATVISDDATGWNDGESWGPKIAIDGGNIHVVWEDWTFGEWGTDHEIMYAIYTTAGWSNATVISDDYTGWNNGSSWRPSIAMDINGNLHVVWQDHTESSGEWGTDWEIMYANNTGAGWSNATVISDDATGWNNGDSTFPAIAIDGDGNIHVIWEDYTVGEWGIDSEIMYANYTAAGWSNATVISDDPSGWNDGPSEYPNIAIDGDGNVHVVWGDTTVGEWGSDWEIMYANYTGAGWSNATVISDDPTGWNDGSSEHPDITIDGNGNLHVVWKDSTDGEWGTDTEIMYANRTGAVWSNATVISDGANGWNDGNSRYPSIAIDGDGNVHVVWQDYTNGIWGSDTEIMYTQHTAEGWSHIEVISDDLTGWNDGDSSTAEIAIDGAGNVHVFWEDTTDGEWGGGGSDYEIMYSKRSVIQPSDKRENFIIIPLVDSSTSIFSPLGLGIIGIVAITAVIISIIIMKKIK